jgi:small subunit ribosomal protein S19e
MPQLWSVPKISLQEKRIVAGFFDEALYYAPLALPSKNPETTEGTRNLPTVFEVPAEELINKLAKHLKESVSDITPPPWTEFAKTGAHKERPPQSPDWWYFRCASLLRKMYVRGPVGVSRLRVQYGGRVTHGNRPAHHVPAGGSAIREPLQQLQKAELVAIDSKKGRKLTREGIALLNRTAAEVVKELKARPQEAPS